MTFVIIELLWGLTPRELELVETLKMKVHGDGTKVESTLEIDVIRYTPSQRLKKTMSWCGIFLGIALLTAFIPVVHFVAVPTFVLLALASLIFVPTIREKINSTRVLCPYCEKQVSLPRPSLSPPFRDSCPECRQLLYIEPI